MSNPIIPYSKAYEHPNGPGDGRPTALQVVHDNGLIEKWTDKVIMITGGTSGIGVETVRALYATGATIFITARSEDKGKAVIDDILNSDEEKEKGKLEIIPLDLESLESVRAAAKKFLARSNRLNILINNAGIMATPETRTKDGFERQFGVNHLAHFVLINSLLPVLVDSSTPEFNSRIIQVSSSSHRFSSVHWNNLTLAGEYDPFVAYGQSKTAMIWTANYIDRVYGPRGVHAMSLHPGGIFTNLTQYVSEEQMKEWNTDEKLLKFMLTPEQGAATTVWAATTKELAGIGGKYLAECTVAPPATESSFAVSSGVAAHAYDQASEERLWDLSLKLTEA